MEKKAIKSKFQHADFPERFINSVIKQFAENLKNVNTIDNEEEEFLIPPFFFEEPKKFTLLEIPYCESNEKVSKTFMSKFHKFTDDKYTLCIKWKTRKIRSLFPLKSRNPYPSNVIYEGKCADCEVTYIGETRRNAIVRWAEHSDPTHKSEPARHINRNIEHEFTWTIVKKTMNSKLLKIFEAFIIALKRPKLNEQVESHKLMSFRHGVT